LAIISLKRVGQRMPSSHIIFIYEGKAPSSLEINHFISDDTDTAVNTSGKIIQAVHNLVAAMPGLQPNNTDACEEYQEMDQGQISHGLGFLKRLAIKHHLEIMLGGGILL
jgi:hypothetical protein